PGLFRLPRARVRAAVTHERPAVVATGLDDIDLVAAIRAVLVLPHLSSSRMDGESDRVPMAERVHLGLVPGLSDEWIIVRHAAIVPQPQNLAGVAVGVLCAAASTAAGRHEERAVMSERDARGAAGALPGDEDVAYIRERATVQRPPRQRQCRLRVAERLRVR